MQNNFLAAWLLQGSFLILFFSLKMKSDPPLPTLVPPVVVSHSIVNSK